MDFLRRCLGGWKEPAVPLDPTVPPVPPAAPTKTMPSEYKVLVRDTVYVLYEPPEGTPRTMDVIFIHGLQLGDYRQAWLTTWQSKQDDGQKFCWPEIFLGQDFPGARVLSVSYDSAARKAHDKGRHDLVAIGEALASVLQEEDVGEVPVFFVGHSLGGLVLKQVCIAIDNRAHAAVAPDEKAGATAFLRNITGMAFYSTPHGGARLADNAVVQVMAGGAAMTYLETLNKDTSRINTAFAELPTRTKWHTLGFCEQHATKIGPFNVVVVEEAAALQGMNIRRHIDADHFKVCKPNDPKAQAYKSLKKYINYRLSPNQDVEHLISNKLIGRKNELEDVRSKLIQGKVVVILGGAGEGKSRLAFEAASLSNRRIAVVDIRSAGWQDMTKEEAKKRLASLCWLQLLPDERDMPAEPWIPLFTTLGERPGMIVYDNAEDIMAMLDENGQRKKDNNGATEAFYELVRRLHGKKALQQIITSQVEPANLADCAEPVRLEAMPGSDAVAILRSGSTQPSEADAKEIARMCGNNAFLLQLMRSFMNEGRCTPQDIKELGIKVAENREFTNADAVATKVAVVGKVIARFLPIEALDWLAGMSLWHSFTAEQSKRQDDKSTSEQWEKVLEDRVRLTVLQHTGKRYSMHLLVREAAEERLSGFPEQQQNEARLQFSAALADIGRAAAKLADIGRLSDARTQLFEQLGNCINIPSVPATDGDLIQGLEQLGSCLMETGHYTAASAVHQQVLGWRRRVLGAGHLDTLGFANNLGNALLAQGKYAEAVALLCEALEGFRGVPGGDHLYMRATSNLGNALRHQGKYAVAEMLLSKALEWFRRELVADHPDTLSAASNLGNVISALGEHAVAAELLRSALDGCLRVLGADDRRTLSCMSNLGDTLDAQGKHAEAEALLHKALAGNRRVLGVDHPDTLASASCLGNALAAQGKHADAEALLRDTLEGYRRSLGANHQATLGSAGTLGGALAAQGKLADAEALFREALDGFRSVLGAHHPETLATASNLGVLQDAQGKHAEAAALLRSALDGSRRVLGADHPDTRKSASNLGAALVGMLTSGSEDEKVYAANALVAMATSDYAGEKEVAARALGWLANADADQIVEAGGIPPLVALQQSGSDAAKVAATEALRKLGVDHKDAVVAAGGRI